VPRVEEREREGGEEEGGWEGMCVEKNGNDLLLSHILFHLLFLDSVVAEKVGGSVNVSVRSGTYL